MWPPPMPAAVAATQLSEVGPLRAASPRAGSGAAAGGVSGGGSSGMPSSQVDPGLLNSLVNMVSENEHLIAGPKWWVR